MKKCQLRSRNISLVREKAFYFLENTEDSRRAMKMLINKCKWTAI